MYIADGNDEENEKRAPGDDGKKLDLGKIVAAYEKGNIGLLNIILRIISFPLYLF